MSYCRNFTEDQINDMIKRYISGEPSTSIAKRYGNASHSTITRILKLNKVEMRKYNDIAYLIKCNRGYFKKIDTEEKAYWLGFIAADGHVDVNKKGIPYAVRICLSYRDREHLEKFTKSLESNHIIKKEKNYHEYKGKRVLSYRAIFAISSHEMANDLYKAGICGDKTTDLNFPHFLRKDLVRHYLRGYIDGDGCWSGTSFSFISTISFLESSLSYFDKELDLSQKRVISSVSESGKVASIRYNGRLQVKKIYEHLYKDAHIFLERKKLAAEKIINVIDRRRVLTSEQQNESLHQTNRLI